MSDVELAVVEVDGHSIGYRKAGQGSALLLLHGFLGDSRCWRRQLSAMSDRFAVVAWDAPGAGSSSDPPDTFTTADYVHCLARFLDTIGIDRAHVVGLSWGGILAQEFHRLHPKRFRSLVLADTYAGWKGSLPEDACRERLANCLLDATRSPEEVVARFLPGMFTASASLALKEEFSEIASGFHPHGFRLMSLSSAYTDTRDVLPGIGVPTLVLWGDDDRRSPMHIAEQIHLAVAHSELAIIPNAGHLSNMEQPAEFNAHIRRFCLAAELAATSS